MADQYSDEALASGPSAGTDPSLQPNQYPASLFGVPLPQSTGAAGSVGAQLTTGGQAVDFTDLTGRWQDRPVTMQRLGGPGDSTLAPGQTSEGISGLGPDALASSGAGHGSVSGPGHPAAADVPSLAVQAEAARRSS